MAKPIEEFVQTASEMCSLIENHEHYVLDEFFLRAEQLLPLLYFRATRLPDLFGQVRAEPECQISHEQWKSVYDRLEAYFEVHNVYWVVHDLNSIDEEKPEALQSYLSDDFADIWRDLKRGLMHWNDANGDIRNGIICYWRFSFYGHWSDHVLDALRAVNHQCQQIEHNS